METSPCVKYDLVNDRVSYRQDHGANWDPAYLPDHTCKAHVGLGMTGCDSAYPNFDYNVILNKEFKYNHVNPYFSKDIPPIHFQPGFRPRHIHYKDFTPNTPTVQEIEVTQEKHAISMHYSYALLFAFFACVFGLFVWYLNSK
jgi:hypothetical protein